VERHLKAGGGGAGKVELFAVALAVVEADDSRQLPFGSKHMGKRNGIEPARADECSLHVVTLVFVTRVGCDRERAE
jgi:hypothetical protein